MKYLTFAHLRAKLGGRARSSIYLDVEAGRLPPPIKLGGRLYWCEEDIDERLRLAAIDAVLAMAKPGSAVSHSNRDDCRAEAADNSAPARDPGGRRNRGRRPLRTDQRPCGARRSPVDGEGTE